MNFNLPLIGTTPRSLQQKAEEFCAREDSDLSGTKAKYLERACFLGWYAYHVLRALGFDDQYSGLDFSREIVWPIGAVLYETIFPRASRLLNERRLQKSQPAPRRPSVRTDNV